MQASCQPESGHHARAQCSLGRLRAETWHAAFGDMQVRKRFAVGLATGDRLLLCLFRIVLIIGLRVPACFLVL